METWKPIPGHDGYEASDLGRVRSVDREIQLRNRWGQLRTRRYRGRVLSPGTHQYGYPRVQLGTRVDGSNGIEIHKLVMLAFVGPPPPGLEVCHNDNDPTNNRLENLRYDTKAGNSADRLANGTHMRGEQQWQARLTRDDVRAIRKSTMALGALAAEYGISKPYVCQLRRGAGWSWLDADA